MTYTKEELNKLISIAKGSDRTALDAKALIIESYQPFVSNMVKKAGFFPDNSNYDDLMAAGNIGLIKAIDTVDLSKASFISWAFWMVRKEIQTERKNCFPVAIRSVQLYDGHKLGLSSAEYVYDHSYVNMHINDNFEMWYNIILNFLKEGGASAKEVEVFLAHYVDGITVNDLNKFYSVNAKNITTKLKLRIKKKFKFYKKEIFGG